ncbi:MAG: AAA family ATPase [Candidatus Shapirobacteria bacterium]|nr:AAA family ATPase [Candidatus Shapirobacteria bacterium]
MQSINIGEMIKMKLIMGSGGSEGGNDSMFTMMVLFLYSLVEKYFDVILGMVQKRMNNGYTEIISKFELPTNEKHSVWLEKDLSKATNTKNSNSEDKCLEAILYNISETYNLKSVAYLNSLYIVNFYEQFKIEDGIYAKLHALHFNDNFEISQIKLQICSDTVDILGLKKYIERCYNTYKRKIQNNLGTDLYFFDMKTSKSQKNLMGNKVETTYSPFVTFEYNKFTSSKSFNNVFGENVELLKKRVLFFKNNKEVYNKKGIPYTFGALLHGIYGSGKTSCIKAIANECNRHIVNINLSEVKTNTQLKNLFYKDTLHCLNDFENISFDIPIHEKLFVIEDIDCIGNDLVLDRGEKTDCKVSEKEDEREKDSEDSTFVSSGQRKTLGTFDDEFSSFVSSKRNDEEPQKRSYNEEKETEENIEDKVTMSSLLNCIDGVLEQPGRMMILTSNYPERLDAALIRPGRIDILVKLDKATSKTSREMFESFYDKKLQDNIIFPNEKWTPAEISCILFNNFDDSEMAIKSILTDIPKNRNGF